MKLERDESLYRSGSREMNIDDRGRQMNETYTNMNQHTNTPIDDEAGDEAGIIPFADESPMRLSSLSRHQLVRRMFLTLLKMTNWLLGPRLWIVILGSMRLRLNLPKGDTPAHAVGTEQRV